jgi:YD repeat-containing protein
LNSLHHWEGLLHNYYRLSTPAPEAVSEPEQFISTIDNGWLAAALVMVRQFFKSESVSSPEPDITGQGVAPTVPSLATGIIGRMDFSKLLEPERNQFYVGYHPQKGEWTTSHYGLRNTEIRPTILMAIAKGNVPSSVWEKTRLVLPGIVFDQAQLPLEGPYYTYLRNPNDPASAVAFIPSWGGSLYEALAPSLFIDEARLSPAGWAKSNLIYTRLHREFATGQRAEYEARIRALKESALKRISEKVLAGSLDENKLADLIPSFLIRENFVMPGSHPLLNFSQNSIQKITVAENLSLLFHEAVPVEFVQENGIKIENIGFAQDGQLVSGRAMEPNGRTLIYEEGALQDIIGEFQPGESRAVRMVMPEGLVYRLSPSREGWQVADLIQAKGADGSDYSIQGNEIVSIKRPDGTVVSALHYKEGHAISGKVVDPDGVIRLFENGKLVEILTPQGFRFKVHNEKIGEIVFPDGRQGKWEDIKDPVTEEPLIAYLDGESRKVYKPSGELYSWIFDRALVSEKENRELWVDTGSGLAKIKRADNSGNLLDAIVELSDGLIYRYQDGKLSTVTLKDGTVLSFSENRIVESFRTDGTRHRFIYSVSGGIIENVEVESTFPDGRVRREGLIPFLARDYALPEKDFLTARVLTEAVDLSPLMATFSTDPRTPAYLVSTTDLERGRVQRIDSTTAPNQGAAGLFARIGASDLRSFRFLNVSLRRDSMTKYPSSVALELKGKRNQSIVIEGLTDQWKDFVIPFDPDLSPLYEVTLLVNHSADTVEPTQVYLDHLTFFAIRYDQTPSLKAALGMSWEELAEISRSAKEVPPLNAAFRTNEPLLREGDKLAGDVRTRIHFGKEGQVIQYSRGDGATVQVTDGKAASIDLPGKATVTQTYENGRLFQSLYKPLENPDDPIEVIHYEYDRIRRIEKEATGEVLYTYRYEFDDLDREVTVVKDQGSGEEQYFLEGRLIRTKRPDGVATTLEYDNKGRIIRAKAAFQDIEEEIFDYTYRDDEILIRDNAGLIRHYDLTGRLTAYTTPEGLTYAYLYREGTSSPELERVELVRYRLNEGTTFYYKDGKLVRMTRADGSVVEELVTNEDGNFVSGILQDRLGVIHRAEKGFASELIFPDGEVQKFLPQHLENIWLEKAGDGTVGISGENENGIYKYDEKGILFRFLARDGIITDYDFLKDEAGTVRSAHVSVKKLLPIGGAKIPTLEEIVVGASDEKTVISAGGKEIDSAKPSEFLLLVIDPLTGEITDQARFDLSKSGEASQMNVSLRLIPQGMFVLGGVSGTNLNWGSELERQLLDNTFQQFGLKSFQSFSKKGGGNWVFIGRRGTEPGAAYEKQTENSAYAHVSSHGLIGKAVYAVSDERLAPTTFAFPPGLIGNAAVTVKPSRGLQIFGRVSNRDAALWRKNFNPLYPESGFYRLFPEVSPFPIAGTSTGDEELRGIARQILALVPNHEKAAVYFDDRYSSSWIGKFQAMHLKSRLVELGVTPLDADGLRLWLEREGPGAVVIMAQDVLPDTAVFDAKYFEYRDEILRLEKELSTLTEELSSLKQGLLDKISAARNAMEEIEAQTFQKPAEEQIIRQYLARGGSMVWMHDEPFYWLGSADGYRNEFSSFGVSENGQEFLLGVRRGWSTDFWKAEKIIPSEPGAFQEIMDEVPESLNVLNPFPESIPAEALNWHLSAGDNRATGVSLDTQNQEWKIAYAFNGTGNEESAKIEIDFLHDVLFANSQKLFDLRGQKLVVDVQIAGEFAGRPLAARFFSRDGAFRTQYGLSFDLSRAQPGNFVRLEYTPDFAFQAGSLMTSPGFDPTQIRFLGIELLANGSTPFEGEIAVRGLRVEGVREEVRHLYTDKELEAQDIFQPSFKISIPWDEIALWYGAMLDMAEAKLPGNLVTVSEVDREGRVIREKEAGGRIILYEQGRVKEIVDAEGHVEKRYHYDDAGELTEIEDLVTREEVDQELSKSRKSLFDREMVLLDLLDEQKGILEQKIKKTVAKQRARLRAQRAQLEANRTQKVCRRVIFWKHCDEVPIPGIDGAIGRINSALNKLAKEEARALGTLNEEIGDARGQVSEKTKEAFRDFETKETDLRKSLLRQEMMPVLAEQYRRYVGRDPSQAEVNQWLERAWAVQGLDLNELVQSLMTSAEHAAKIDRKNRILGEIAGWMEVYLQRMGDAHALEEHLAGLGLVQEDIQFNGEFRVQESNWPEILRWLESQDLHFGDSAYRTLLAFAEAQGIPLNDIVLASRVILIDILTGVVNQITEGTLKPSLFALDHAASLYGVEHFIQRLPSLDSLERLISESKMPVMAHINGDHYVLVASVGPELVRYRDLSVGENGEFLEVTRASFLEIWEGTVMAKIQAVDGQEISRTEAKKIKGAFFFLIPVFAAIASAVTAAVSAAVAAVTAVISAIGAAISAALGAIQGALAGLVSSIGNALGAISQGLLHLGQGIWNGLQFVGGKLLAGVKFIGTKLLNGVQFLKSGIAKGFEFVKSGFLKGFEFVKTGAVRIFSGIKDGVVNGFNFLKQGLNKALDFLTVPKGDIVDGVTRYTTTQLIARQVVRGAIGLAAREGLKAMGVPDTIANLAGAFLAGGITGGTGTATASGATNFFRGSLQALAFQGVSELGRHLDLPPPLTDALSIVTRTVTGAALDPSITIPQSLKNLSSKFWADFSLSGLKTLGQIIGLDPKLTSLIGIPLRATLSSLVKSFVNPGVNGGLGDIFTTMKAGLKAGITSIGFDFGGKAGDSFFGSLGSKDIIASIESVIGQSGLFSKVFEVLNQALLNPFNLAGNFIQNLLSKVTSFDFLIQEKGIIGALESMAASIFSRRTIERIRDFGGISGLFGSVSKVFTTLETGEAQELKISDFASLFFDLAGNFIGKKENGILQIGEFGIDSFGKFALITGKVLAEIFGGFVFSGDVKGGQLFGFTISNSQGVVMEGDPEGDGPIVIEGPEPGSQSSGSFWNTVFHLIPYALEFLLKNNFLQNIWTDIDTDLESSEQEEPDNKPLFVLTNGIASGESHAVTPPSYILNLMTDLVNQSQGEILLKDIIPAHIFLRYFNEVGDGVKDIIHWIAESQIPFTALDLVLKIVSILEGYFAAHSQAERLRPVVGMGFSGGFAPLVEALALRGYNAASIVGLGAATMSIAGIGSEVLNTIIEIASKIESGVFEGIEILLKGIPLLGNIVDSLLSFMQNGLIQNAFELLKTTISKLVTPLLLGIPSNADFIVNVWGTKDIVAKLGIGGYRDEIAGLSTENGQIFNIEIIGATHFDYMRYNNPTPQNVIVSDFVTKLITHSTTQEELIQFLNLPPVGVIVTSEVNRFVVRLPGM